MFNNLSLKAIYYNIKYGDTKKNRFEVDVISIK